MRVARRDQNGETLFEIVMALVVIGLVVGAFLAAYATSATGSKAHRDLVTADAVLRDYAEATKSAVRAACVGGSTYTVPYTAPGGYTLDPPSATSQSCPAAVTTVKQIDLTVTMPNGNDRRMSIRVRTP
jgi:hypothetical protein